MIALRSLNGTYINPGDKLKLEATVKSTAFGVAAWSINSDSGVNLASQSLTPLSQEVSLGVTTLFFALPGGVLDSRS